jgi:RHS repeat-associated protein
VANVRILRPVLITFAIIAAVTAALILLPAASATDDDRSAAELRQQDGVERELPELRTATSRTFATAAGTNVTRVYAEPVNFRAGGGWRAIDNTLTSDPADGYALTNRANAYELALPDSLAQPVVVSDGRDRISFELEGANGAPVARGGEAHYPNALPGVDVVYEAQNNAVKESLVLDSPAAGGEYTFAVEASDGLRPRENDAGGIDFVRDGATRLSFAPPWMQDAAPSPARSEKVTLDLRRDGPRYEVVLRADRDWLRDERRVYPVTIDPTTTVHTNDDCYMVSGSGANTSYCGYSDPLMYVGTDGTGNVRRGFMRVDTSAIPKTAEVLKGELKLYVESGTQRGVDLHRVTRESTSARTWNRYDATNAWTTPGGDLSSQPDGSNSAFGGTVGIHTINARRLAQGWVDGSIPNYGLVVKDNGATAGILNITGDAASNDPVMDIAWAHRTGEQERWTFAEQQLSDRMTLKTNVANGNLILEEADIQIPGTAGHDLDFSRNFNNLEFDGGTSADDLGKYWRHSGGWDVWLRSSGGGSTQNFNGPGNFWAPYDRKADGTYETPTGMNADLKKNADGTHTLTYRQSNKKIHFNTGGMPTSEEDRNGNKITYSYGGPGGKLSAVKDSHDQGTANNTLTLTYTADGYIDKVTDRSSPTVRTWDYNYTGNKLTSYVNPDGRTTSYAYDTNGSLDKVTDPRGTVTDMDYDASYRVISIQRDEANAGPETKYEYPASLSSDCSGVGGTGEGKVVGETIVRDPLYPGTGTTHTTKYCWDKLMRVQKTVDGRGKVRSNTYTPNSEVNQYTSAGNQAWDMTYTNDRADKAEAPPTTTGGSRMTHNFGYDSSVTDKSNQAFWLQKSMTDERGKQVTYGYDAKGNLTDINTPLASQNNIHLTVNSNGTTASIRDANGTGTTSYGYTNGNLTSIDRQNHTAPSGMAQLGTETFSHDAVHRVATHLDGAGQTATFTYDALDRMTNIAYSGSRGSANAAYAYDTNGNMTSRVDSTGTSTYTYDRLNRLTQEALPNGTTTYTYDAAGNMKTLVDAGGTTTYNYGATNLLDSMQAPGDTAATTFEYTDDGTRRKTIYPNTVVMEAQWEDGSSGNSGPGRLKSVITKKGTTTLSSFAYGYTPTAGCNDGSADSSLRHTMTTPSGTANYCYDALGRLKSATNHNSKNYSYTLDGNGNIKQAVRDGTTTSFAHNEADQLCWSVNSSSSAGCGAPPTGATTYTHDADGNMTATSAAFSASYNVQEQATTMTSLSGTNSTGMVYSGPNQSERVTAGGTTFLNNALGVGAQTTAGATTRFRRDDDGGLHSERVPGTNTVHYYVFDGLGSVAGLSDAAGTTPLPTTYSYDPYGLTTTSGSANVNPWKYASTYQDPTGFYKMGLRYYHPSLMRWTQRDPAEPLTDPAQAMLYGYAGGDPISRSDPNGDLAPLVGAVAGAVVRVAGPPVARFALAHAGRRLAGTGAGRALGGFAFRRANTSLGQRLFGARRGSKGFFNKGNYRTGISHYGGRPNFASRLRGDPRHHQWYP